MCGLVRGVPRLRVCIGEGGDCSGTRFSVRNIVIQKTKLTTDCTDILKQLMDMLITESDSDKRSFISACLSNFGHENLAPQTYKFIMEQVINVVMPPKPVCTAQCASPTCTH